MTAQSPLGGRVSSAHLDLIDRQPIPETGDMQEALHSAQSNVRLVGTPSHLLYVLVMIASIVPDVVLGAKVRTSLFAPGITVTSAQAT